MYYYLIVMKVTRAGIAQSVLGLDYGMDNGGSGFDS
jgi:hypothetical protein